VADPVSVQQAVRTAESALGGLDGVVNAAGIFAAAGLADTSAELFSRTLAVNLMGTFLAVQAAAPSLLASQTAATIVNIGSGVGITPTGPGSIAYVASKGGVIAMTKALAMELAPSVRVNVVCPGAVETPMTQGFLRKRTGWWILSWPLATLCGGPRRRKRSPRRFCFLRPPSPHSSPVSPCRSMAAGRSTDSKARLEVDSGSTAASAYRTGHGPAPTRAIPGGRRAVGSDEPGGAAGARTN